ncbi:MAG: hypothetical protein FWG14_10960 [Peptococcaceae bacterium]|nr:hypothetical protein [Peptococcaceae bacterium]
MKKRRPLACVLILLCSLIFAACNSNDKEKTDSERLMENRQYESINKPPETQQAEQYIQEIYSGTTLFDDFEDKVMTTLHDIPIVNRKWRAIYNGIEFEVVALYQPYGVIHAGIDSRNVAYEFINTYDDYLISEKIAELGLSHVTFAERGIQTMRPMRVNASDKEDLLTALDEARTLCKELPEIKINYYFYTGNIFLAGVSSMELTKYGDSYFIGKYDERT